MQQYQSEILLRIRKSSGKPNPNHTLIYARRLQHQPQSRGGRLLTKPANLYDSPRGIAMVVGHLNPDVKLEVR